MLRLPWPDFMWISPPQLEMILMYPRRRCIGLHLCKRPVIKCLCDADGTRSLYDWKCEKLDSHHAALRASRPTLPRSGLVCFFSIFRPLFKTSRQLTLSAPDANLLILDFNSWLSSHCRFLSLLYRRLRAVYTILMLVFYFFPVV